MYQKPKINKKKFKIFTNKLMFKFHWKELWSLRKSWKMVEVSEILFCTKTNNFVNGLHRLWIPETLDIWNNSNTFVGGIFLKFSKQRSPTAYVNKHIPGELDFGSSLIENFRMFGKYPDIPRKGNLAQYMCQLWPSVVTLGWTRLDHLLYLTTNLKNILFPNKSSL